ncbi:MAG: hypothetical protein WEB88_06145 [Gemmatimonadota bacterium]
MVRNAAALLLAALVACVTSPATAQHIDPRAAVEIGGVESDDAYQLHRVIGVRFLGHGGIVVGEADASRLRLYDAAGRHLRDVGGRGGGPAELRELLAFQVGDPNTLLALDRNGSRLRFSAAGTLLDRVPLELTPLADAAFNVVPWGLLPDGRILLRGNERLFGAANGRRTQRFAVYVVEPEAGTADTTGVFAAVEVEMRDGMPWPLAPPTELLWAPGAEGTVWLGSGREYRLRRMTTDGRVVGQVLASPPRPPVGRADLAELRRRMVARGATPNDQRVIAEWVDALPPAERAPALRAFFTDGLGRLWVQAWERAANGGGRWTVYDASGTRLFQVNAPPGLELTDAGAGSVVGIRVDELDRERVQVHALVGTGG